MNAPLELSRRQLLVLQGPALLRQSVLIHVLSVQNLETSFASTLGGHLGLIKVNRTIGLSVPVSERRAFRENPQSSLPKLDSASDPLCIACTIA